MNTVRDDEEEASRDTSVIEDLARSKGVRLEEVRRLYLSALAKMKQTAAVFDFLPIFAARHVKEALKKGSETDRLDDPKAREE
jgi:hypothetical protein